MKAINKDNSSQLNEAIKNHWLDDMDHRMFVKGNQNLAFDLSIQFLSNVNKKKSQNNLRCSGTCKHIIENQGIKHVCYVYDYTFILAALSLGFHTVFFDRLCTFNFEERSFKNALIKYQEYLNSQHYQLYDI